MAVNPTDTDRRLAEIRARLQAAAPVTRFGPVELREDWQREVEGTKALFLHAPADIAFLLDLVQEQGSEILRLRSIVDSLRSDYDAERIIVNKASNKIANLNLEIERLLDLVQTLKRPASDDVYAALARLASISFIIRHQLIEHDAERFGKIGVLDESGSLGQFDALPFLDDLRTVLLASPLSSLVSPALESAPPCSDSAAGSESGLAIHLEMRPEEEIDLASLAMPPLKEIDPADVSRMRGALSGGVRPCPNCARPGMRLSRRAVCLTCAGNGLVGSPSDSVAPPSSHPPPSGELRALGSSDGGRDSGALSADKIAAEVALIDLANATDRIAKAIPYLVRLEKRLQIDLGLFDDADLAREALAHLWGQR